MRLFVKGSMAVGLIGLAVCGGTLIAQASEQTASDEPPSGLEEDYSYPGADEIFATYGVKLVSGDGHILFAPCSTPPEGNFGLMQVRSSAGIGLDGKGRICFKVTAPTGHLELKIPAVYEIQGDGRLPGTGHKAKAEVTTDAGIHTTVDVNPYGSIQVGVGANPGNPPTTLLRLDVMP
jgi:hypothetical protein